MKKIILTCLTFCFFFTSCEFDKGFEEMNVNPNSAAQIGVANKITYLQTVIAGGRYENWRNSMIYNSTIIQHHAENNWWAGDTYNRNDDWSFAQWNQAYGIMVKTVEDIQAQLIKEEKGNGPTMGITKILRVFIYHRVTDLYGDIPYSEAGKGYTEGILKPKYDTQQEVYMGMLDELEKAVAMMTADSPIGGADVIFAGNATKWKAFGNSMMLRLAMRLTKADEETAKKWAVKAVAGGTMTSNDHIAAIKHGDGNSGVRNGHGEVFLADQGSRISTSFMSRMTGDPRKTRLFMRNSDKNQEAANLIGMKNGLKNDPYTSLDGVAIPAAGDTGKYAMASTKMQSLTAPMVLQTYAEVEFLKAEMAIRGWSSGTGKAEYDKGVTAGMKMLSPLFGMTEIANADITTFLAGDGKYNEAGTETERWEQAMDQYWIATYFNEYEAYSNWRRSGFPNITATRHPSSYTGGEFMVRMIYPTGESVNNEVNYNAAVTNQGADTYTTKLWWDK